MKIGRQKRKASACLFFGGEFCRCHILRAKTVLYDRAALSSMVNPQRKSLRSATGAVTLRNRDKLQVFSQLLAELHGAIQILGAAASPAAAGAGASTGTAGGAGAMAAASAETTASKTAATLSAAEAAAAGRGGLMLGAHGAGTGMAAIRAGGIPQAVDEYVACRSRRHSRRRRRPGPRRRSPERISRIR